MSHILEMEIVMIIGSSEEVGHFNPLLEVILVVTKRTREQSMADSNPVLISKVAIDGIMLLVQIGEAVEGVLLEVILVQ